MLFPEAQGWESELDQDNRSYTMAQPGAVAVIFHDAGKGPSSGEQDSGAEAATQMPNNCEQDLGTEAVIQRSTVSTLQHSPKFKSLFDQLGYGPQARLATTEALMRISVDSGPQCFANEEKA